MRVAQLSGVASRQTLAPPAVHSPNAIAMSDIEFDVDGLEGDSADEQLVRLPTATAAATGNEVAGGAPGRKKGSGKGLDARQKGKRQCQGCFKWLPEAEFPPGSHLLPLGQEGGDELAENGSA